MSQRSAFTPAAIATALVSDPPRPSVATRPSSLTPWKPGMTQIVPPFSASSSSALSTFSTRALPWIPLALTSCQPMKLRACSPKFCSVIASRPAVTCSPLATTTSYSLGSCSALASRQNCTSRSVSPAIALTTTSTSLPASASRFTRAATLRMRSMPAIDVPPNFITIRAMGSGSNVLGSGRPPC